jgi:hypothetical protein
MSPTLAYRIAAGFLGFFALAHTGGMLAPTRGAEEDAALAALAAFRFDMMGATRSHFDFYRGEGWYLTLAVAAMAATSWQLGAVVRDQPALARRLIWVPAIFSVVSGALCVVYFFPAPLVCSWVAAGLLVFGAARAR